jgi:hypothetical protein
MPMPDDDNQEPPPSAVEGRSQHFGSGMVAGQVMPSQSLQETARRYNAQTPTGYKPNGSASGMSAEQYQSTLGGMFPTANGMAETTYNTKKYYGSML